MTILEFVGTYANQHLVDLGEDYWMGRCKLEEDDNGCAALVLRLFPWETPDGLEKVEFFVTPELLVTLDGDMEEFEFSTMRIVDILDTDWEPIDRIWYAAMFCFDEFIQRAIDRASACAAVRDNHFTKVGVKYRDMGTLILGAPDRAAEVAAMVADLREIWGRGA